MFSGETTQLAEPRPDKTLALDKYGRALAVDEPSREISTVSRLYRSDDFWLHVQLEQDLDVHRTTLIGHLGERQCPLAPLQGICVTLFSSGEMADTCFSDASGAVEMHYDSGQPVDLQVTVGPHRHLMPLP